MKESEPSTQENKLETTLGLTTDIYAIIIEILKLLTEKKEKNLNIQIKTLKNLNTEFQLQREALKDFLKEHREQYRRIAAEIIKIIWHNEDHKKIDFLNHNHFHLENRPIEEKITITIVLLANPTIKKSIPQETFYKTLFYALNTAEYSYYDISCYCLSNILKKAISGLHIATELSYSIIQSIMETLITLNELTIDELTEIVNDPTIIQQTKDDVIWYSAFNTFKLNAARFLFFTYSFFAYKQYWPILFKNPTAFSQFKKIHIMAQNQWKQKIETLLEKYITGILNFTSPNDYLKQYHLFHLYPLHAIYRGAFFSYFPKLFNGPIETWCKDNWETVYRIFDYTRLSIEKTLTTIHSLITLTSKDHLTNTESNLLLPNLTNDIKPLLSDTVSLIALFFDNFFKYFDIIYKKSYSNFFRTNMLKITTQLTNLIVKFNTTIKTIEQHATSHLRPIINTWKTFYRQWCINTLKKLENKSESLYLHSLYRQTRIEAFKLWNNVAFFRLNENVIQEQIQADYFALIEYLTEYFIPNIETIEIPVLLNMLTFYINQKNK